MPVRTSAAIRASSSGSRRAVGHAEHRLADRAVRHELRDVDADAPGFERLALRHEIGRAAAIRVDEDRRDALRQQRHRRVQRARQALGRVRVHVDESWRDNQPRRVDRRVRAVAPFEPADRGDAVAR